MTKVYIRLVNSFTVSSERDRNELIYIRFILLRFLVFFNFQFGLVR